MSDSITKRKPLTVMNFKLGTALVLGSPSLLTASGSEKSTSQVGLASTT